MTSTTYDIAAETEADPSCNVTAVASAPPSAVCELGMPPTFQNAETFLLKMILTSWHTIHAIAISMRMFMCG